MKNNYVDNVFRFFQLLKFRCPLVKGEMGSFLVIQSVFIEYLLYIGPTTDPCEVTKALMEVFLIVFKIVFLTHEAFLDHLTL